MLLCDIRLWWSWGSPGRVTVVLCGHVRAAQKWKRFGVRLWRMHVNARCLPDHMAPHALLAVMLQQHRFVCQRSSPRSSSMVPTSSVMGTMAGSAEPVARTTSASQPKVRNIGMEQ